MYVLCFILMFSSFLVHFYELHQLNRALEKLESVLVSFLGDEDRKETEPSAPLKPKLQARSSSHRKRTPKSVSEFEQWKREQKDAPRDPIV